MNKTRLIVFTLGVAAFATSAFAQQIPQTAEALRPSPRCRRRAMSPFAPARRTIFVARSTSVV